MPAAAVLAERNFRLLFAARTISFFGTNLAPIAVAFAVLGLTGSPTDVGLAFAAWTLAQISTLLVGGVVADRLPRRLVMIGSDTYAPFFVLGPYVARQSLGGVTAWTIVVTGEAIGSLAGGLLGLRLRPRRPMLAIGALFVVTALQVVLLALRAPALAIGAAAVLAGLAFSFGTVVWDTSLQRLIAPEKLSRVSAYNWLGAMAFLPAGYAIAGPVADLIGISTSLWIGAAWIVVTTAAVLCVPGVRNFRSAEAAAEGAPVPVTP